VNWLDGNGKWSPEDDATLNMRRTLSGKKPYLLLMNTNYDRLTTDLVEKYFQRCLFYGIYPSMFSHNAADNPYWQNPRWYNRDRELFKKYIPVIKTLSLAGWEPVTNAASSNPDVYVERFGARHFTLLNPTGQPQTATLTIDPRALSLNGRLTVRNLLTASPVPAEVRGGQLTVNLTLAPEQSVSLELLSDG
jgi:hypothetical protein